MRRAVAFEGGNVFFSVGCEADPEEAPCTVFNGGRPFGNLVFVPAADDALIVEDLTFFGYLQVDGDEACG